MFSVTPHQNLIGLVRFHTYMYQVKWAGCDHFPVCSAQVKNGWSYSVTPSYAFVACPGTTLPFIYISQEVSLTQSQ